MPLLEVGLESAGQSTEIEIVEFYVQPGDSVVEGQPLVEVATDKVNTEVVAPQAGTVSRLLAAVGDVIAPPTKPLLIIETA